MALRSTTVTAPITTASNFTLDGVARAQKRIRVTQVGGTGRVSLRVDGTAAVLDADETWHLSSTIGASIEVPVSAFPVTVSAIASVASLIHIAVFDASLARHLR